MATAVTLATPEASVTEVKFDKTALAPPLGAVNVTNTPLIGMPLESLTVAWRAFWNTVATIAAWGVPPEAVYLFKHALVQDTAYRTLLRGPRRQLHGRIAEALTAHHPELTDSQPELFARHYAEAGLVGKSVACWGKAGHRSAARSAMVESAAQFQNALDQLALLPDNPDRLLQELEFCCSLGAVLQTVKGLAAPETGYAYARARELWMQLGSPAGFLHLHYLQSRYHMYVANSIWLCV